MDLQKIAAKMQSVYENNSHRFDTDRNKDLFELPWLEQFTSHIPEGENILDIGCGSGRPITQYFIKHGYEVTGVDYAEPMLTIARKHFPEAKWLLADMRNLNLKERFCGIVGWNSFFHLTQQEQRKTLPILANHLKTQGILMLTVGPEAGEVTGKIGDETVYHSSLSKDEYCQILEKLDLKVISFVITDPQCEGACVILAQKC